MFDVRPGARRAKVVLALGLWPIGPAKLRQPMTEHGLCISIEIGISADPSLRGSAPRSLVFKSESISLFLGVPKATRFH